MLTAAELHEWAEREGLYVPLTPRGTDYLRSLLQTWVRHHRLVQSDVHPDHLLEVVDNGSHLVTPKSIYPAQGTFPRSRIRRATPLR